MTVTCDTLMMGDLSNRRPPLGRLLRQKLTCVLAICDPVW